MRYLLRMVALSLMLGAGASLPAAADFGNPDSNFRDWSHGPRFHSVPVEQPQAYRSPQRTYGARYYDDDDEGARPRRRSKAHASGYTKRRHVTRHGGKAKSHQIARRHSKGHRVADHPRGQKAAVKRQGHNVAALPKGQKTTVDRQQPEQKAASQKRGGSGSGQHGVASYYWQGQRVASGGWFNPNAMTAAHKTLPFGTRVRVTHLGNGRTVEVTINDRGPFVAGRIIDLSKAAAGVIGMTGQGIARVSVDVLGRGSK
jgi:rare lipoprotein A